MSDRLAEAGRALRDEYPGVWYWQDSRWDGPLGSAIEAEFRAALLAEIQRRVEGLRVAHVRMNENRWQEGFRQSRNETVAAVLAILDEIANREKA